MESSAYRPMYYGICLSLKINGLPPTFAYYIAYKRLGCMKRVNGIGEVIFGVDSMAPLFKIDESATECRDASITPELLTTAGADDCYEPISLVITLQPPSAGHPHARLFIQIRINIIHLCDG